MKKDKRKIPKGMYCYKYLKCMKDGKYKVIGVCPYWSKRKNKPKQENGYCSYLEKGDWEINQEQVWEDDYTGEEIKGHFSLLWDRVKECGIKED